MPCLFLEKKTSFVPKNCTQKWDQIIACGCFCLGVELILSSFSQSLAGQAPELAVPFVPKSLVLEAEEHDCLEICGLLLEDFGSPSADRFMMNMHNIESFFELKIFYI